MRFFEQTLLEVERRIRLAELEIDRIRKTLRASLDSLSYLSLDIAGGSSCTGTLHVTVTDGTNPVVGASVTVAGGGLSSPVTGTSGAGGIVDFTIISGTFVVTATASFYYGVSGTAVVVCNATTNLTLAMTLGAPVFCGSACPSVPFFITITDPVLGAYSTTFHSAGGPGEFWITGDNLHAATGRGGFGLCSVAINAAVKYEYRCVDDKLFVSYMTALCGGVQQLDGNWAGVSYTDILVLSPADVGSTCSPFVRNFTANVVAGTHLALLYPGQVGGTVTYSVTG